MVVKNEMLAGSFFVSLSVHGSAKTLLGASRGLLPIEAVQFSDITMKRYKQVFKKAISLSYKCSSYSTCIKKEVCIFLRLFVYVSNQVIHVRYVVIIYLHVTVCPSSRSIHSKIRKQNFLL